MSDLSAAAVENQELRESAEQRKRPSKYDPSITEGPLGRAVWNIAWPSMLPNMVGGLQLMVDHIMVGHLIGFRANAAIGVSNQIILVVIVFVASIFAGMNVLVARFAGARNEEKVNRTVYHAFLTTAVLSLFILAPLGFLLSPYLLDLVNADPTVKTEALPFLRITFAFNIGLLIFFMLSGALRSAGDARTPMQIGIVMTVLNMILNIIFINGFGPIPSFGVAGSAMGSAIASGSVGIWSLWSLTTGRWVVRFPRGIGWGPDWQIIRQLFRFGLPTGIQGIAMNIGGVMMLSFVGSLAQSAAAQAAFAVSYSQLFSLVTWTSVGLMGAAAAVAGQNLGAKKPDRTISAVNIAAKFASLGSIFVGIFFFFFPEQLLSIFGMTDPEAVSLGVHLLRVLAFSGLFVSVALTYTGGLQGTGDTKSPLYISIISQVVVPVGICFVIRELGTLAPMHIWLSILIGHVIRCVMSVAIFRQGKWRNISVDIHTTRA